VTAFKHSFGKTRSRTLALALSFENDNADAPRASPCLRPFPSDIITVHSCTSLAKAAADHCMMTATVPLRQPLCFCLCPSSPRPPHFPTTYHFIPAPQIPTTVAATACFTPMAAAVIVPMTVRYSTTAMSPTAVFLLSPSTSSDDKPNGGSSSISPCVDDISSDRDYSTTSSPFSMTHSAEHLHRYELAQAAHLVYHAAPPPVLPHPRPLPCTTP
jgi:hypothetical protein